MSIEDIQDTLECRAKILEYYKYLESGNESISEDFEKAIITKLFTKTSLLSFKVYLQATYDEMAKKLEADFVENMTEEEATKFEDKLAHQYDKIKTTYIKQCLQMEILHKHTRADSIKEDPIFAKQKIVFKT